MLTLFISDSVVDDGKKPKRVRSQPDLNKNVKIVIKHPEGESPQVLTQSLFFRYVIILGVISYFHFLDSSVE